MALEDGKNAEEEFLLTPLREGRLGEGEEIPYSKAFLLTPLREGRPEGFPPRHTPHTDFYSRPCGRGDAGALIAMIFSVHFYSRPCGRGDVTAK